MTSDRDTDYSRGIELTLFEVASGMTDPAERSAFLDKTCHGDADMRDRLEKLLNVRGKADSFFDMPPVKMPADMSRIAVLEGEEQPARGQTAGLVGSGAFIGRFKLVSRIGEGGCGVVYRAEQLEPVRREVALKVIRLGMDTEAVISRFELERQALAMMEHPNIARVLDAGTTTYGCPFFVMELVDGEKITDFCKGGRVGLHQRLDMFIQICGAIQHAHQKGVIHRDIKPSNVLVPEFDGEPVPKVIDFGIAKATLGDRPDSDTVTVAGQFLGTPAYMSPEQARGGADGNDASASKWAARCLSSQRRNAAREASARIILAMIEHRAGHHGVAAALLDQASPPVMKNSHPPLNYGDDVTGSWHAWLTARILLNEAEALIRN
jgi:serine/threonine protein kinase